MQQKMIITNDVLYFVFKYIQVSIVSTDQLKDNVIKMYRIYLEIANPQ